MQETNCATKNGTLSLPRLLLSFFFTKAARAARKLGGGGYIAKCGSDFVEKTWRKKGASSKKYKTTLEENI